MKRLLLVFMAAFILLAFASLVVGVLAFTPIAPNALAALSRLQLVPGVPAVAAAPPAEAPARGAANQAPASTLPLAGQAPDLQTALTSVYEAAGPSVVNISVTKGVTTGRSGQNRAPDAAPDEAPDRAPNGNNQNPGQNGQGQGGGLRLPGLPDLRDLPNLIPGLPDLFGSRPGSGDDQRLPGLPGFQVSGEGSGFVWDTDGHIVTNNHVVEGASKIRVTFSDGATVPAALVGTDPDSDLAVIKVDPKGLTLQPLSMADSTQVKVGQFVVAIGNPFGLQGSMSLGIVSAVGRSMAAGSESLTGGPTYSIPDIIQTDASMNPGNSGGVLLNLDGELVGVPTAIESPAGTSSGVGFCIPSAIVQNVVPALIQTGKVEHPYLGFSGMTLSPDVAQAMGLNAAQRGALIGSVAQGSPAEKAGLRGSSKQVTVDGQTVQAGGDVIVKIEDQPIKGMDDLISYLAANTKVGQTVTLTVLRDAKEITAQVTLAARPGQGATQPAAGGSQGQAPDAATNQPAYLGITTLSLNAESAQAMKLPQDQRGVLVQNVTAGSPAEAVGLRGSGTPFTTKAGETIMIGGDVITAVDGQTVTDANQLSRIIRADKPGQQVRLSVLRDGKAQEVMATLGELPD